MGAFISMWLFKDNPTWSEPVYTLKDEIAACATHGFGAALSIAGLVALIVMAALYGDTWRLVGFSVYGITLVTLYLASTLYHGFQNPRLKRVLRTVDHAAIYVFIAGTYTPFLLISLQSPKGWTLLVVIWTMALAGILWKIFFLGRFEVMATIFYVIMSWMAVIALKDIFNSIPPTGVFFILLGGAFYMFGIIFYAWERLPYNHTIWHLFVLGGSISHYFAITTLIPV